MAMDEKVQGDQQCAYSVKHTQNAFNVLWFVEKAGVIGVHSLYLISDFIQKNDLLNQRLGELEKNVWPKEQCDTGQAGKADSQQ